MPCSVPAHWGRLPCRFQVKARATNEEEGAGALGTLGVGSYAPLDTHSAHSSPTRSPTKSAAGGGDGLDEEGTPRHGDESPLLRRSAPGSSRGASRGPSGRGTRGATGEGAGASPRALPAATTFVANPRVEQWIAGSESSFDKSALARHLTVRVV